MRILANENFSPLLVETLREHGHDVAWVKEIARGSSDAAVLQRAQRERRVVATFDKGFGELAFRWGLPADCGVLLMRIEGRNAKAVATRAAEAIESRADWSGLFATITNDQVRVHPLRGKPKPRRRYRRRDD